MTNCLIRQLVIIYWLLLIIYWQESDRNPTSNQPRQLAINFREVPANDAAIELGQNA